MAMMWREGTHFRRWLPIAAALLLACSANAEEALPVESGGTITATERWELRGFAVGQAAGNHTRAEGQMMMPDVLTLSDGSMRMYYGQRSPLPTGENILVAASTDGGQTWAPRGVALAGASTDNERTRIIGGPSVIVLPDGRYRMFSRCSVWVGNGRPDYHIRSAISDDGWTFTDEGIRIDNKTWDPASPWLTVGHGRFYALADGSWAAILSVESVKAQPSDLALFTSLDSLHWTYVRTLYKGFHDPVVVHTDDGYLMVASYLTERAARMHSADGLSWPAEITALELFEMGSSTPLANERETGDFGVMRGADGELRILSNFPHNRSIAVFERAP
jgi:hypothetical protein|tara:strand:+ start:102 stop:1103 length:1002 start_codon:yes stop_codon:yes gene_type:complete